jgi:hypothetical protein
MSHTENFAQFRVRKAAERKGDVRVTWKRASDAEGGYLSGLGPDGRLYFVRKTESGYSYGRRVGSRLVQEGERRKRSDAQVEVTALAEKDVGAPAKRK